MESRMFHVEHSSTVRLSLTRKYGPSITVARDLFASLEVQEVSMRVEAYPTTEARLFRGGEGTQPNRPGPHNVPRGIKDYKDLSKNHEKSQEYFY